MTIVLATDQTAAIQGTLSVLKELEFGEEWFMDTSHLHILKI